METHPYCCCRSAAAAAATTLLWRPVQLIERETLSQAPGTTSKKTGHCTTTAAANANPLAKQRQPLGMLSDSIEIGTLCAFNHTQPAVHLTLHLSLQLVRMVDLRLLPLLRRRCPT